MATQVSLLQDLDYAAQHLSVIAHGIRLGSPVLAPDENTRRLLIRALQGVLNAIMQPSEKLGLLLPQVSHHAAIRLLMQWNAFEVLPKGIAMTFADLAARLGADESLITRLAGILIAHGTLQLVNTDRVAHTALSEMFSGVGTRALLTFVFEDLAPIYHMLPNYFQRFGRKAPSDPLQTPVAYAHNMLGTKPEQVWHADRGRSLRYRVAEASAARPEQAAVHPTYRYSWIAAAAARAARMTLDVDRVVLVDVSGDEGAGMAALLKAYPDIPPRRCVLEDTQERLDKARAQHEELAHVQCVKRDQVTDPPSARGALCYHIRHRLRQCHEAECVDILTKIAGVMLPDSKLLVSDLIASFPPTTKQGFLDMNKLLSAGEERSLNRWKMVMHKAGLEMIHWETAETGESVIECVLKEVRYVSRRKSM